MSEYSYTSVSMSPEEYQARLTHTAHNTIIHLAKMGFITEKDADALLKTVIVVPIANNTLFGRVRDYIFGKTTKENKSFSQYIVTQIS